MCVCVCARARSHFSHVWLFTTPWTGACQAVHWIFQAQILERVAMPSSRGSSRPKDQTQVSCISCIARWILYHWGTGEAHIHIIYFLKLIDNPVTKISTTHMLCFSSFHFPACPLRSTVGIILSFSYSYGFVFLVLEFFFIWNTTLFWF